jgi:hypothetical protein
MLVNSIIPAVLPPAPPRKTIKLDPEASEIFIGEYEIKNLGEKVVILKEEDKLYIQGSDGDKEELFAETENQFFGTSKDLGNLQITFIRDSKREVKHLHVYFGFIRLQFDKIKP